MSRWKVALAAVAVAAGVVAGGTWVYIHVIQGDAPARLSVDRSASSAPGPDASTSTSSPSAASTADPSATPTAWKASSGSQAGYRVKEVLFGQSTEAVGRTTSVTGSLAIEGTSVTHADMSVDLRTVRSDQSRRDGQFQGRIMNTSQFPTAAFSLTQPIALPSSTPSGTITASATGQLTVHGVTKKVTFDVHAQRTGGTIKVDGTIPVVFADYGIPNPSLGPATTQDHGDIEFLLVFVPA